MGSHRSALFDSASVLPMDKCEMLQNCWRYKCAEGKFAVASMIIKISAEDCSEIWEKAIGNSQKSIEEMLGKLYSRAIEVNKNKNVDKRLPFRKK